MPQTNMPQVLALDMSKIIVGDNVRSHIDDDSFDALCRSINEVGIIEPIIVREVKVEKDPQLNSRDYNIKYEIVAGHRRYFAAKKLCLMVIPAITAPRDIHPIIIQLTENLLRKDLNPIDEAQGFNETLEKTKMTQNQLAKQLGKSQPYISNSLRLLGLPKEIKEMLIIGKLDKGHAKLLMTDNDTSQQLALANKIVEEGLSVRGLEKVLTKRSMKRTKSDINGDFDTKSNAASADNAEPKCILDNSGSRYPISSVIKNLINNLRNINKLINEQKITIAPEDMEIIETELSKLKARQNLGLGARVDSDYIDPWLSNYA